MPEADEDAHIAVTRDPNFVLVSADNVLVIDLGRDLELALLREGPAIIERAEMGEGSERTVGYEMAPALWEVGRLRLAPATGVVLALSILNELAPSGRMNKEKLRATFDDIIAEMEEADESKTVKKS